MQRLKAVVGAQPAVCNGCQVQYTPSAKRSKLISWSPYMKYWYSARTDPVRQAARHMESMDLPRTAALYRRPHARATRVTPTGLSHLHTLRGTMGQTGLKTHAKTRVALQVHSALHPWKVHDLHAHVRP